jgi:hypothetical protein
MPALGRLRQENLEFQATSLGYRGDTVSKTNKQK